jgi:hypothetical protein
MLSVLNQTNHAPKAARATVHFRAVSVSATITALQHYHVFLSSVSLLLAQPTHCKQETPLPIFWPLALALLKRTGIGRALNTIAALILDENGVAEVATDLGPLAH